MMRNPKTIRMDMLAYEALSLMEKFSITNLIVTNETQEPFGIIHIHDILMYKSLREINKNKKRAINGR
jgi:arabinose-5-phosphate isomerase